MVNSAGKLALTHVCCVVAWVWGWCTSPLEDLPSSHLRQLGELTPGLLCMTCRKLSKAKSIFSLAVFTAYITLKREGLVSLLSFLVFLKHLSYFLRCLGYLFVCLFACDVHMSFGEERCYVSAVLGRPEDGTQYEATDVGGG